MIPETMYSALEAVCVALGVVVAVAAEAVAGALWSLPVDLVDEAARNSGETVRSISASTLEVPSKSYPVFRPRQRGF